MNVQVLVSTMHQKDYSLLEKMNINSDAIVINQCDKNSEDKFQFNNYSVKWFNCLDRGLSMSRNKAIVNASADVCVLADDDLEYIENYNEKIIEQFKLNPQADIIAFQVEGIERKFKNYNYKPKNLNFISSMKVSSVEIAFRLENIKKANVEFNLIFGAGAKYKMGEENIFLTQCLKKGLKIKYIPVKIANLHMDESSWFDGYNKEYFISKGAQFAAMSKIFSFFYVVQYILRKHKVYKKSMKFIDAFRYMKDGRCEYLNRMKSE